MSETALPEADLLDLATRALTAGGMLAEEAALVARVLVLADLFGVRTHGISRVAQYLDRVRIGGIDARADVATLRVAPGLATVDGRNGIGPLVGMRALEAAMEGARAAGIGAAFARGSNHFGPIMPYALLAAEQGFASIIASNATTTIAPWGGKDTRVGNNPIGIGVPNPGGDPVILDMALSVAARAKIRALAQRGELIPEGWATDSEGKPTTDPKAALSGFLLPVGGHKGYGLAVMVDLLAGLLSGASYLTHVQAWDKNPGAPQNLGHVFILIDTSRLGSAEWLRDRMADFAAILHETPAADSASPVMLPGEREMAAYARGRTEGVRVATADIERLRELAGT
ncbi:Ldh family oxidoreductase [Roseomonas sp. SSH11]|uniref:Ldh family oxidoreductase n=1 Tax=Pararoseomonas baculiformis TaxID=2820812 RepID=A0ABS4AEW8_9PROT|nr:Ldh family oxidoreductase [Pararoseomonas baculiformis]MBP0445090.1 Ldh family oxidoreductase [Pararoseomonas baculiformis]